MKKTLSSLTLQQLLYRKNTLFNFTIKQFINLNCYLIGNKKKKLYKY